MQNNQKTIQVVSRYFYPVMAGVEMAISETYKRFVKHGWKIVVYTSTDDLSKKHCFSRKGKINGIIIKRSRFTPFGFVPSINYKSDGVISLHNFNIFPHFYVLFVSAILKTFRKKKYTLVLTPHGGCTPNFANFSRLARLVKKLYFSYPGKILINFTVDIVRAIAPWEKEELVKLGIKSELIVIIENGVEDEAFWDIEEKASKKVKDIVLKQPSFIIQLGRISRTKNQEMAIRSLVFLPKYISVFFVGPVQDTKYKMYLLDLATKLKIEKRVFFIGEVYGVDKYYLLKHAIAYVHPAVWEGFSVAVVEAMSQGAVCVVSDIRAFKDIIHAHTNGYTVKTPRAIAESINKITGSKSRSEIKRIQRNNIAFAKTHSWEKIANQIERIYSV